MMTKAWHEGDIIWIKKFINKALIITFIVYFIFLVFSFFFGVESVYYLSSKEVKTNVLFIILVGLSSLILGQFYWVSTFLHSITDFKFEFKIHIIVALSISILGGFAIMYYGVNLFILIIGLSWGFLGFIPVYFRSLSFLKQN